jgi:hypothetical protein
MTIFLAVFPACYSSYWYNAETDRFLNPFASAKSETNKDLNFLSFFFLSLSLNVANTFQEAVQLHFDRNRQKPD